MLQWVILGIRIFILFGDLSSSWITWSGITWSRDKCIYCFVRFTRFSLWMVGPVCIPTSSAWVCLFPHILAIRMGCVVIFLILASLIHKKWYPRFNLYLSTDEFELHCALFYSYICLRVGFFFLFPFFFWESPIYIFLSLSGFGPLFLNF